LAALRKGAEKRGKGQMLPMFPAFVFNATLTQENVFAIEKFTQAE